MASHGGTISIEAKELARTLVSGPIGGVVGGQGIAERLGLPNVLCTDIGGTSFDIALITDGRFEITPTPGHRPLHAQHAAGQDRLDRRRHRVVRPRQPELRTGPSWGPTRPASRIGVCWPEGGLETVSVTDLNLVLGRVNPDYFLGGDVKLDPERARAEVERQVAEPLGLEVEDAAAGVIELFEQTLQERGGRPDPRQGLLARRLRAALLRRRRAPARRRLHRGRPLPRRPGARLGGGVLRLRLRLRRLRVPLRPDDRHADPARRRTRWRRRGSG